MTSQFYDDDALLTRDMAAAALTAAGYPIRAKTLATKATRGGGPPYRLFGVRPLYRWADTLAWAHERLSTPRCSTSVKDAEVAIGHSAVTDPRFTPASVIVK